MGARDLLGAPQARGSNRDGPRLCGPLGEGAGLDGCAEHRRYNGRFPCFFFGLSCLLLRSISSAAISLGRVSWGSMTSSR